MLAQLSLSHPLLRLDRMATPLERDVLDAQVPGEVKIEAMREESYVVRVPLGQLRRWGLASFLPAQLLSQTFYTWEQVDVIVRYCLTAALQPGLRSLPIFVVHELLPGALGPDKLHPHKLIWEKPCSLYVQETKFMTSLRLVPQKLALRARKEYETVHDEVMLTGGVFMASRRNVAVDIHSSLPLNRRGKSSGVLHVLERTKHTGTGRRASDTVVEDW